MEEEPKSKKSELCQDKKLQDQVAITDSFVYNQLQ